MQVRKLHHIRKLGHIIVTIDILKRKNLVGVVLELDDPFFTFLGTPSAITDHGLFILVCRDRNLGLVAFLANERCGNPSMLRILYKNEGLFLFTHDIKMKSLL